MARIAQMVGDRDVWDIGCGRGRLVQFIPIEQYYGVDADSKAIDRARENFGDYRFAVADVRVEVVRTGPLVVLSNVLMHNPDDDCRAILSNLPLARRALVAETMDPQFRDLDGAIPCYNRSVEELDEIFAGWERVVYEEMESKYLTEKEGAPVMTHIAGWERPS